MSDWLNGPSKLNIDFNAAPFSPMPAWHLSMQNISATIDLINLQMETLNVPVSFQLAYTADNNQRALHIIRSIQTDAGVHEDIFCVITDKRDKKIDIAYPLFMNASQKYSRTNTNWQYVLKNLQKAIFVGLPEDIQLKFDQAKAVKLFDYFTRAC
jgi:hypothetical protein